MTDEGWWAREARLDEWNEIHEARWLERLEYEMDDDKGLEVSPLEEKRRCAAVHLRAGIAMLNESGDQRLIPAVAEVIAEIERLVGAPINFDVEE